MRIQNQKPLSDVHQEQQVVQEREQRVDDIPVIKGDQEIIAETVTLNAEDLAITADTVNALLGIIADLQTRVTALEKGGTV